MPNLHSRLLPTTRRGRIVTAMGMAGAVVAAVWGGAGAAMADGPGPRGHTHFVQIASHGAPLWRAEMQLRDNGRIVADWVSGEKTGGKETWWYTPGGNSEIILKIIGSRGPADDSIVERDYTGDALNVDHCFLVKAGGTVNDTGDSRTGGCTPG